MKISRNLLNKLIENKNISLVENEIDILDDLNLDNGQMDEVFKGITNGLSFNQVLLYSNSKFSKGKMKQIRLGLEAGLGSKIILYSKYCYNRYQMRSIRWLLLLGVNDEYIKLLNDSYSYKQMLIFGLALESGIDKKWALGFVQYDDACNDLYSATIQNFCSYKNNLKFSSDIILYNFSNEFYSQSVKILLENNIKRIEPKCEL